MTYKSKFYYSGIATGISLIIMALLAFFAYGYVWGGIVLLDQPIETLNNLLASKSIFIYGSIGWIGIILLDLIVSYALYIFFKDVHPKGALFGAVLRLIYTVILGIAVSNLFQVTSLLAGVSASSMELATETMTLLKSFDATWSFGLIIFGLHLLIVGYVAFKSDKVPKVLSILVMVAGISYVLLNIMFGLLPQLDPVTSILEMILVLPMTIGELGLGIWMIVKGRKLVSIS